jgi:hypothetical protein
MKQTIKLGIIVLVAAAMVTSGIAIADSGVDPGDEPVAEDTHEDTHEGFAYTGILERLAPLVEDGTITQEQAEAVAEHLAGQPRQRWQHRVEVVRGAAELLGLSPEEILEALREGSTLAEIAAANGSSGDELIAYLVDIVDERLTEAVADGRITEEQKAEALERATDAITTAVNSAFERPLDGPHGRFPHGPGGPESAPEGNADGASA